MSRSIFSPVTEGWGGAGVACASQPPSALVLRLSGSVNVNTIHNTIAYFMTQEEELTWFMVDFFDETG